MAGLTFQRCKGIFRVKALRSSVLQSKVLRILQKNNKRGDQNSNYKPKTREQGAQDLQITAS